MEFRDLDGNFIWYNGKRYTPSDMFNHIFYEEMQMQDDMGPICMAGVFNSAIAFLGSYLTKRGYKVDYINSFNTQQHELIEKLKGNVRSIAIPTTLYTEEYPIVEIIQFIRKYNREAKIILGGPYIYSALRILPKQDVSDFLKRLGADYYVVSTEGEEALGHLVEAIKTNASCQHIHNLYFLSNEEYVFTTYKQEDNPFEEGILNLSFAGDSVVSSAYVRTTKSCPFACSFCSRDQYAGSYQTASVEVIESILDNNMQYESVKSVIFVDDTLNVPPNRFKDMLRMMIRKKYPFKWHSYFRCQFADREMVELMRDSGCEGVFLGIESGSQAMLDNMNKSVKIEQYYRAMRLMNEYGITTTASFIIGFPGETYETFLETKRFIEECKPTFFRASSWVCDPLSPINNNRDKWGLTGMYTHWKHNTMDSATARDLQDELFLDIDQSIWTKFDEFDSMIAYHIMDRGLDLDQMKQFLGYFNLGLKERLRGSDRTEISPPIMESMRQACVLRGKENELCR
ncbi:radical SAM protein [Gorillibacterium sp. sgz500922]|uniref:radical SAM protein n=1 Tax=Gorillibacterium sp. sgz500922 TaxID=3446694 RepID=UPI003F66592F